MEKSSKKVTVAEFLATAPPDFFKIKLTKEEIAMFERARLQDELDKKSDFVLPA